MKQFRILIIGGVILSLATVCFIPPTAYAVGGALPPEAKVQGMAIGE